MGEIGTPYTHPATKQCSYVYTHPSTKQCDAAAGTHSHAASDITSGTLAVARGGTGITSNPSMLTNLGSGSAASVFASSPRPGVTGTLPVANGGTGVTSIDALKSALGLGGGTQYSGMTYNLTGIAVGKPVLWGNEIWICVHVSGSTYYLSSTSLYGSTIFGSNNSYSGSTLAAMCAQFQNIIPADSLALAVNTTVNGVTAKIFCPSYEQYNGGFRYFNSDANRICQASNYWTSSPASIGDVYCVSKSGSLYNNSRPSDTYEFRPCVALSL